MNGIEQDRADRSHDDHLRKLSDEVNRLAASVAGPLRSIRLRSGAAAVEVEWENTGPADAGHGTNGATGVTAANRASHNGSAPALSTGDKAAPAAADEHVLVRSPMVGTFYHAAAPGEPPFVSVGGTVGPDTVIGVVEAMKLMNRITADRHGVVRELLVSNEQPVEFEQPLILLDPPSAPGTEA